MKFKSIIQNKTNFFSPSPQGEGLGVRSVPGVILFLFFLFLSACSGLSHLPAGDKLYTGAEIKLVSPDKTIKNKKLMKTVAENTLRPKPNWAIFGIRPALSLYMSAGPAPKSSLQKWLRKTGEAPVLMSNVKPAATAAIIDASLFNMGIFNSYTEFKIVKQKKTASVIYTSRIHKPYTVKDLIYSVSDENLSRIMLEQKDRSFIKNGEDYNLSTLKNERIRIDVLLKNSGYFYFNPDYLLFKADTSAVEKTITFHLTLKDSIPPSALRVYRINNVYINQNYSLNAGATDTLKNVVNFENVVFFGRDTVMKISPKVILRSIYLRKNDIYLRQNHTITLNRLMSMGNFKFVQVKFTDSDTTATGYLDVTILMTPLPKHTFSAELDLVSRSNNYTGPRMNMSLLNRNTFKGAELLKLNLAGSFEAQLSGVSKNLYSYSFNPQVELSFPRFLVPFKIKQSNSIYVPKTNFTLTYNYLQRVNYFDMSTFQFGYGFRWKTNLMTEHEFNPVNISYTSLGNQSATFLALLNSNPFLKKSYEEQFIAGGSYSFTFNEQVISSKKIQYYFNFSAETAGNLFSLAKLIGGEKATPANPLKIIGSPYSQYAKLSVEGRANYNISPQDKFVMRFYGGVAQSYGNSSVLPYSKQFFSGGPNSIRAFQINSLGPGTYDQRGNNIGFLQLGGDIKLEMNAEYRFTIYRFFKGALFMDAGNVWLQKSNPANTGSPFMFSTFMNELAVGAGVGLRVDVSFFVLRFDVGMPLRKPWLPDNQRWVINQINFADPTWRSNNLILNIAIGYPF